MLREAILMFYILTNFAEATHPCSSILNIVADLTRVKVD